jgi:predicted Zn-dependent protease
MLSARTRTWLAIALAAVIGVAGYRIGVAAYGAYHRRALDDALAIRDFARAEKELARCLWIWPGQAELHLQSARLARRQGHLDEARRQLRRCRADRDLAVLVGFEESLLAIQSGDFAGSSQLDEYARANPQSLEALLIDEAQILGSLAALDASRARSYLARWMEQRTGPSDQLQGLLWQAQASLVGQDADKATADFRAAVRLNPTSREARLGLVRLLAHTDPAETEQHLKALSQTDPADAAVRYQQAVVERNLGRIGEAARTLDGLLEQTPDHVEALVLRGRVALDRRQLAEAEHWFRRAEQLQPDRHAVLLALAEYLRLAGRAEEAEGYDRRVQEVARGLKQALDPKTPDGINADPTSTIHGPPSP